MENRQYLYQLFTERGFLSVSGAAKALNISIDIASNLLLEMLQFPEISAIYSIYDPSGIKLVKNPSVIEGATLFAISQLNPHQSSFNIEYSQQRPSMRSPNLVYPPCKIGPYLQTRREFEKPSINIEVQSSPAVLAKPVEKASAAVILNSERNKPSDPIKPSIFKGPSQSQISFAKASQSFETPEKIAKPPQPVQNKIDFPKAQENQEVIEQIPMNVEPKPKPKKKSGINEILSSSIYTAEEEDRMDIVEEPKLETTLKRKLKIEEKDNKKVKMELQQPTPPIPMPEGPRVKHVKTVVSKTYINEKGYLVTEDVVEDQIVTITDPEPRIKPTQILGCKKGTQSCMQAFLVKS
ncbi:unnamed protein product [Blepharisma stoltei]|uniref:Uncharacterized protein n=1 Tax=Blepharisma stoltei TaxID=1481888 RepID=A0AAU9IXX0_9CILI|nr:unnamed protein product [Blepharisma stoltei]